MRTGRSDRGMADRGVAVRVAVLVLVALVGVLAPVGPSGPLVAGADPVLVVTPDTGLVDGQEVQVSGTGFGAYVMLAVCPTGLTDERAESCAYDQDSGYAEPDGSGSFTVPARLPAVVSDGAASVDCRLVSCELVALQWIDEEEGSSVAARVPVAFDPGGPLVPAPVVAVTPSSGLVDGQTVRLTGSGFEPDEWVWLEQCGVDGAEQGCRYLGEAEVDLAGVLDTSARVRATVASEGTPGSRVDCRSVTAVCRVEARADSWRDPDPVPLHFDPVGVLLPAPVLTAAPTNDLVDGQVVQVTGSGLDPWSYLNARQCGPTGLDGWTRCRWLGFDGLEADGTGALHDELSVRAVFTSMFGGDDAVVDCRVEACWLQLSGSDVNVSVPLTFDPAAPLLPPPSVTATPATGIVDGQTVAVTLTGFDPNGWPRVEVCQVGTDRCDPAASASPEISTTGPTVVELRVFGTFPTYEEPVDCRRAPGCEIRVRDGLFDGDYAVPISFGPPPPSRGRFLDPVFDDVDVQHDVVYRNTTDHLGRPVELKMDIYQPVGDPLTVRPVVMWMHGGWFIFGDKSSMEPYARASAQRGYVSISLQYRLRSDLSTSDLAGVVAAAHDARVDAAAAVDWIQANAGDLGIDPRAIFVGGYSAGGVLAWNLAYPDATLGHGPPEVAAAAPIAGIPFTGPEPGDPPVIGFHAVDDSTVPYGEGRNRCAEAVLLALVCQWEEYPDGGHGIVSSRFRDIVDKSHTFFYEQVLLGLGYHNDTPVPPPGPTPVTRPELVLPPVVAGPTTTTTATTTTTPSATSTPTSSTPSATSTPGSSAPVGTSIPSATSTPTVGHQPGPRGSGPARPATAVPGRPGYTG